MLQMFLSAGAVSTFFISLFSLFPSLNIEALRVNYKKPHSLPLIMIGAGLLGCGMAICGACPGTVVAQMGTGIGWSYLVFIGAIGGTISAALLIPNMDMQKNSTPDSIVGLENLLSLPMWAVGFSFSLMMAALVVVFAVFFPYDGYHQSGWILTLSSWPPYATGIIVGSLQIPGIFFLRRTIGSSTSYVIFVAAVLHFISPSLTENNSYLSGKHKFSAINWWQPTYIFGAFVGALVSAALSGNLKWGQPVDETGMGWYLSLIGGFCILFGARLAGGCTSGHGISGFSLLITSSAVAVICMFSGGIACAFFLQAVGAYPSIVP